MKIPPNKLQVMLLVYKSKIDFEKYEDIYQVEMDLVDFNEIIKNRFIDNIKTNGRHLLVIHSDFKIYCGTDSGKLGCKEIDIYGEVGLNEFIELSIDQNWQLFDKHLNRFLDLRAIKEYGYFKYAGMMN